MIEYNLQIFKKIFSLYYKYIYLILFLLIAFFTFTDLYLKNLTENKSQLKKLNINFQLSNEEVLDQIYKVSYYNLVRRIYTNLLEDKIKTDFNELYKNNDIIKEDGFQNVDFKEIPVDVISVQLSIVKKISQAIADDYFLNENMRFEYDKKDMIVSDNYEYSFFFDLQSMYNLKSNQIIEVDLYSSLNDSLESSFSEIYNELYLFSGYTNFLTEREILKKNNPRFSQIIKEQNENLNLSYQDAKKALDYLSNPKNYTFIVVENYEGKVPSFITTFLFAFIIFNLVIFVFSYIYYYFKS
tara:strand:+ start:1102 stop:1995 length:894 start_codon:yes stop_codon:yes gene_type:complete